MFAPTICAANAELLRQPSTQESVRKAALQVQEKADKGVCKPQADSEVRANSAGRVEQVFPRIVFSGMGKDYRANHVRPLRFVRQTPNYYINHPHKSQSEKQHRRYRKRQTKAFASLRRTARHERIPPNGFWELSLGQCFQKLRGDASIAPYISHVSIPAQGTP